VWAFGDEGKRLIFGDGDNDRQNIARLFLGGGVNSLQNAMMFNTVLTQGGSQPAALVCLPGRDLKLIVRLLLCHFLVFLFPGTPAL